MKKLLLTLSLVVSSLVAMDESALLADKKLEQILKVEEKSLLCEQLDLCVQSGEISWEDEDDDYCISTAHLKNTLSAMVDNVEGELKTFANNLMVDTNEEDLKALVTSIVAALKCRMNMVLPEEFVKDILILQESLS